MTVNGAVAVSNPPRETLKVEGSVTVNEPVVVTLPDAPVRCVIENSGNHQSPQGFIQGATFRGITLTLRAGDVGLGTINSDCHAAFPRSRICTDQEILMNSFPVPTVQDDAWIVIPHVEGRGSFDGAFFPWPNCNLFRNQTAYGNAVHRGHLHSAGDAK